MNTACARRATDYAPVDDTNELCILIDDEDRYWIISFDVSRTDAMPDTLSTHELIHGASHI